VIELFDDQLRVSALSRLRLLSEMRHAVDQTELRLHYQPVLDLVDESVVGVEALLRWEHPTRGLVGPDGFIPFAERSGLIIRIGDWVLREACRQAAAWGRAEPGRSCPCRSTCPPVSSPGRGSDQLGAVGAERVRHRPLRR
jgi:sensor c-di-GMP phosphodiesterase-like protein